MNSSTYLIVESASNGRSNQTTITSRNDRCAPESPPPPYITPPGTILRNMNLTSLSASMKQICPIRRTWLRRSAQYPQSSNDHPPLSGPSFTNAEALDTNRTDCVASSTNRLKDSPEDVRIVHENIQEDTTVLGENNRHISEEDDEPVDK